MPFLPCLWPEGSQLRHTSEQATTHLDLALFNSLPLSLSLSLAVYNRFLLLETLFISWFYQILLLRFRVFFSSSARARASSKAK